MFLLFFCIHYALLKFPWWMRAMLWSGFVVEREPPLSLNSWLNTTWAFRASGWQRMETKWFEIKNLTFRRHKKLLSPLPQWVWLQAEQITHPHRNRHTIMYTERHVQLKTEAAPESALRSSLFKEQTAWLLQGPGRGNDRLTHGRREKGKHCKNARSGWFELNAHHPHSQTRGISDLYRSANTGVYAV